VAEALPGFLYAKQIVPTPLWDPPAVPDDVAAVVNPPAPRPGGQCNLKFESFAPDLLSAARVDIPDQLNLDDTGLIAEEGNPALKLRVFVQGGGCSGFQYGFSFEEQSEDGDFNFTNLGVTLVVDPMSFQYLANAEIDYREGLEGAQFVIRNPNAKTTCGCGSSFSA
jgi:iron-sulfur cluster insertion protein